MSQATLDADRLRPLLSDDGQLYSAGRARYPGDCTHMVGEIKGPTTYGSWLAAVGAEYVADEDRTHVAFVHCRPEVARDADVDGFGTRRVRPQPATPR